MSRSAARRPNDEDPSRLVRVKLSNGYLAYRPVSAVRTAKPEKRVRFVKGYDTKPTALREPPTPSSRPPAGARKSDSVKPEDEKHQQQQQQRKKEVVRQEGEGAPAPADERKKTMTTTRAPPTGGRYMEG